MTAFFSNLRFLTYFRKITIVTGYVAALFAAVPAFSQTSEGIGAAITKAESAIGKAVPEYAFPTTNNREFEYPTTQQIDSDLLDGKIGYQYNFSIDQDNQTVRVRYFVIAPAEKIHSVHENMADLLNTKFPYTLEDVMSLEKKYLDSGNIEGYEKIMSSSHLTIEPGREWQDGKYYLILTNIYPAGMSYFFTLQVTLAR